MRALIDYYTYYYEKITNAYKGIIVFDENNVITTQVFKEIASKFNLVLATHLDSSYRTWFLLYKVYPEWIISMTVLIIILGPYVIWVVINILVLIIMFIWYFTIYSYNNLIDKNIDIYIFNFIIKIIIEFKNIINFSYIFKFNYNFIIIIFFPIFKFFDYVKISKYNYDMYGNKLILIKKNNLFIKTLLYINMSLDSFYYQYKLKLDWRSLLTFHIDEAENEDPEDYEQIILWPLLWFRYKSYLLRIFKSVTKFTIFDKYTKRRRFNFFNDIKKNFLYYFFFNIKKFLIFFFFISFFNIIILNLIFKILKYIVTI